MKLTLVLMTVANLSLSACQQNDDSPIQKKNSAVIKSEQIVYFDVNTFKNERSGDFGKDLLLEYDPQGNLIKESMILFDENSKEETVHISSLFHYENGKRVKVESFSVLRGGIKKDEVISTYQKDGKLEKQEFQAYENGKKALNEYCFFINYTYAKDETENHYSFDKITQKFIHSFRLEKKFDKKNNLINQTYYDSDNKPYRTNTRAYNSINQLIKESTVDEYVDSEEMNEYNNQGDIVKVMGKDGSETIYTYKYDDRNNWIEKTEKLTATKDGKSEIITNQLIKRSLNYY